MDGRGRWMDHVFIEQLWRGLKYECVFLNAFETGSQARSDIGFWIDYCNQQRPHSTFGGRTLDGVYGTSQITEQLGRKADPTHLSQTAKLSHQGSPPWASDA